MIVVGNLNFFKVETCGLYKHGEQESHGCELVETFDLIGDWVRGKQLIDTLPWDPEQSRDGVAKCYCHDFYKCDDTGEYVLVLWKADGNGTGTLLGAREDAQTGQGDVIEYNKKVLGKKVIWGRPAYYWIVPRLNAVISIKCEHSVCDSAMFQDWVNKCITNRVPHKNKHKEMTEKGFVRLSFADPDAGVLDRFSYRFDMKLCSVSTGSSELRELAKKVTHVVRRETIRLSLPNDDRAKWVKMFDKVPYLNPKDKAKTRQIEVRAEAKPTATEIKAIIEGYAKESRGRSDWDNVGFKTEDGSTVWVDRYRLHAQVNFNQEKNGAFLAAYVHERVSQHRGELLSQLEKSIRAGKVA